MMGIATLQTSGTVVWAGGLGRSSNLINIGWQHNSAIVQAVTWWDEVLSFLAPLRWVGGKP